MFNIGSFEDNRRELDDKVKPPIVAYVVSPNGTSYVAVDLTDIQVLLFANGRSHSPFRPTLAHEGRVHRVSRVYYSIYRIRELPCRYVGASTDPGQAKIRPQSPFRWQCPARQLTETPPLFSILRRDI